MGKIFFLFARIDRVKIGRRSNQAGSKILPSGLLPVLILFLLLPSWHCVMAADHYSIASGNWNSVSTWSDTPGGAAGTTVPAAGDNVFIEDGYTVTLDVNTEILNLLSIASGGVFIATSGYTVSAATITVDGTYNNGSTGAVTVTTMDVNDGGIYIHSNTGIIIPTANWHNGSTCEITGWTSTTTLTSSFDQDFYNFTWNCPNQSVNVFFNGYVDNVTGTFTLVSTGPGNGFIIYPGGDPVYGNYEQTGGWYDVTDLSRIPRVFTVTGDFSMSGGHLRSSFQVMSTVFIGGNFTMSGGTYVVSRRGCTATISGDVLLSGGDFWVAVANFDGVLIVEGDFEMSGGNGTLFLTYAEATANGTVKLAGDFIHTLGNIREDGTGYGTMVFNGTATQTYTSVRPVVGTISYIVGEDTNLPLLQMGTGASPSVMGSGSDGTFTILPGATLGVTSPDGITTEGASGNIQVTGSRTYSAGANYLYNGTVNQTTGNGLPANLTGVLTVNNTGASGNNSVALSQSMSTAGDLTVTSGILDLGEYTCDRSVAGGTLTVADGATLKTGGTNTMPANFSSYNMAATSTVEYNGSAQTVASGAYGNLFLSGTGIKTISNDVTVDVTGDLTTNDLLTIESSGLTSSGSLIVNGTSTGNVTYNRFLREGDDFGDRHLFTSPVGGQSVSGFVSNHSTQVDAVRVWDEVAAVWSQVASGDFISGKGYNIQQADISDGGFSFTGQVVSSASVQATSPYAMSYESRAATYPDDPYGNTDHELDGMWAAPRSWINWGGGGWNLLGNPFTSAMSATEFIDFNLADFDPFYQALYLYDGANARYLYAGLPVPGYEAGGLFGENIQAGQGFMVMATSNNVQFDFTSAMQTHSPGTVMLKSSGSEEPWPGFQLKVSYGQMERSTTVVYNDNMTAGLDPGYDVGQLSTYPDVEIYTVMTENDQGVNLARQALPVSEAGKITVPVGIDTEKGGEVVFSAETVPIGNSRYWLEDRVTGIWTDLTTKSYQVNLPSNTYGTGRFYVISSATNPTSVKEPMDEYSGLRIWTYNDKVIIKGEVGEKAICEIYSLSGQKILETRLDGGNMNTVAMPAGTKGILIIRVVDGIGESVRKVMFLEN